MRELEITFHRALTAEQVDRVVAAAREKALAGRKHFGLYIGHERVATGEVK